ncbi:hypothetical protein [Rhodoplanes roseus]|uniref:Nutrient deprivation-induced protein n=1 Tax=Rhodoplanes roseus TaxID=29409 RepID=A0A327KZV3_9BRAD|nr:hypothetical protein [Rhodoplanes roseus]RAI43761.1 hypothetical protein CH341_12715 [Rhodoplanes roseus]
MPAGTSGAGTSAAGASGAGASGAGSTGGGASGSGPSRTGSPQDDLRRAGEQVAGAVKETASGVKDEVVSAATELRDQAAAMAEPLQQKARSVAEEQKKAGAEKVSGVARAISSAADDIADEMPQAAAWVRKGASQLEQVSSAVRDKSVEELARDAERFARNNTAAFFGLSLVAGFALARFLKSGAPNASSTQSHAGSPQGRTASPPLQPQPGSPGTTYPRSDARVGARTDPTAFPHNEF